MLAMLTAVWLGILTSISPCPLATNVAAVSFISSSLSQKKTVVSSSLLYTLGRVFSYSVLGFLMTASILSVPETSFQLQKIMNRALGPVLILTGMFILELLELPFTGLGVSEKFQKRIAGMGFIGAFPMGAVFALAFCPVSAALFFGSLIPLAIKDQTPILYPLLYGLGTALPVIAFAFLFAFGTRFVSIVFSKLALFEKWARRLTGLLFVAVGIYYSLVYIFKVIN